MCIKAMNLLAQLRKTGFGLGFIAGGLFIGAGALWSGQAHAHDFKQGDLVIDHPYATPTLAVQNTGAVYLRKLQILLSKNQMPAFVMTSPAPVMAPPRNSKPFPTWKLV
mgnify:CR=1 FL=1